MLIRSSSNVTGSTLCATLVLLILGPTSLALARGPQQPPAGVPGAAVARGSGASFASSLGCGPGLQTLEHTVCLPDDCTSTDILPFLQRPMGVPKFDPSLGTLTAVRLQLEADLDSYLCLENLSSACSFGGYDVHASFALGLGVNDPPLAEPVPLAIDLGWNWMLVLGPSDGFPDCNAGPQGPPPNGTCTGSDHLVSDVSHTSVVPAAPISAPAELAGWVLGQGSPVVEFRASADAGLDHYLSGSYSITTVQRARLRVVVSYEYCPHPVGEAFCFGDGTGTLCPCGNQGQTGEGCANSSGGGALITAAGSAGASADDLVTLAQGLPSPGAALLFAGTQDVHGGAGLPFGDGLRCAGGTLVRLGVRMPSPLGEAAWGPGLVGVLGAQPGDLTHLQVWYRDPIQSPCGAGSNLSNGLRVTILH